MSFWLGIINVLYLNHRASDSLTDDESESKSGSSSDDGLEVQAKDRRHKDPSVKNGIALKSSYLCCIIFFPYIELEHC